MDSCDVIVCWPKHLDYPLWRDFIKKHGHFFGKVIIAFTETHQEDDYSTFVMNDLGEDGFVYLFPETPSGEDWRNIATNMALDQSTSRWIWFTEQDFFILDPNFWVATRAAIDQGYNAIGFKDGNTRMHPCNLWVERSWIEKTGRDFGIVPDKLDHFARFWTQLRLNAAHIYDIGYDMTKPSLFYHMNGLSHNLTLVKNGEPVTYKEDEFAQYIYMTLNVDGLDRRYMKLYNDYWENYVKRTTET